MRAGFSFDAPPTGGNDTVAGVYRLPAGEWQARCWCRDVDRVGARAGPHLAGGVWRPFTLWCQGLSQFYGELVDWGECVELVVHIPYAVRHLDAGVAAGILAHFLSGVYGTAFQLDEVAGPCLAELLGADVAARRAALRGLRWR
jgi:hypothetical protein